MPLKPFTFTNKTDAYSGCFAILVAYQLYTKNIFTLSHNKKLKINFHIFS